MELRFAKQWIRVWDIPYFFALFRLFFHSFVFEVLHFLTDEKIFNEEKTDTKRNKYELGQRDGSAFSARFFHENRTQENGH